MAAAPVLAPYDPIPTRGLSRADFRCVAWGGLGDGHNNYAHSMAWYKDRLYLGTTRSNMCMLRLQKAFHDMPLHIWPVDCPETRDDLYKLDLSSQIWCYDPMADSWEMVFKAPVVEGHDGLPTPREIGYRSMEVFQGARDPEPALYVSAWGPGRSRGGLILRSFDGRTFEPVTDYGILETPIGTTRCLTGFKGRMFFAPTARRGNNGGQQNTAGLPLVFESADPASRNWIPASEPGFGDAGNLGIFTMATMDDRLFAGTLNLEGFQIWASECEGTPPYKWHKIIDKGASRGPANQAVLSMTPFKGALYVGGGIQGGGFDRVNGIGPAAAELIRVNPDGGWDLISGEPRTQGTCDIEALAGLRAGFGNFFNGYLWSIGTHDGWIYCGTYDRIINLRWAIMESAPERLRKLMRMIGTENLIDNEGGADLWRSHDGENWLPVCTRGFGNAYNWGIRNILSTPAGLFVGTANVFGPRVAVPRGDGWGYEDNPRGGLEIWLGRNTWGAPPTPVPEPALGDLA